MAEDAAPENDRLASKVTGRGGVPDRGAAASTARGGPGGRTTVMVRLEGGETKPSSASTTRSVTAYVPWLANVCVAVGVSVTRVTPSPTRTARLPASCR